MARRYAVAPAFFSPPLIGALRREALLRDRHGQFQQAGIGHHHAHQHDRRIRRDRTLWLEGATLAQCRLLARFEELRLEINRQLFLGLFDLEAHFAIYDPGAFYRRHLDTFNDSNARVLSVVLYLNEHWQPEQGGQLRLWAQPEAVAPAAEVEPRAGVLACFFSDQIPHEVLEAHSRRISIAGWFRRRGAPLRSGLV